MKSGKGAGEVLFVGASSSSSSRLESIVTVQGKDVAAAMCYLHLCRADRMGGYFYEP